MIASEDLINSLCERGTTVAIGVPCSFLKQVFTKLSSDDRIDYIGASSEAEACGIAVGSWLAGKSPIVVMQNSGFCDSIETIGSLMTVMAAPIIFLVSARGEPGKQDEEQHEVIGRAFLSLVDALGLPIRVVPKTSSHLAFAIDELYAEIAHQRRPGVLVVPKDTLEPCGDAPFQIEPTTAREGQGKLLHGDEETSQSSQLELIAALRATVPSDTIFVSTAGYASRSLAASGDRPENLYLAGGMGCASAVGFGLARYSARHVVVLDGDGAALMRLGNLATIGGYAPKRFTHVVLNNGRYASTGGQLSMGRTVSFAHIALACGYQSAVRSTSAIAIAGLLKQSSASSPLLIEALLRWDPAAFSPRVGISGKLQADRMRSLLRS